ncbi:MAG TPA: alpha/beta hydrolase, partial [Candidatus Limnocylindria bacterium]
LAIEVDPTVRRRAWEMQRLAIDQENDDAPAKAPEPPSSERLGEVRAPTLVAVGELDQPDMVDIAQRLAADIPNARHVVLPGVAHLPPMERPAEFATLVRQFIGS